MTRAGSTETIRPAPGGGVGLLRGLPITPAPSTRGAIPSAPAARPPRPSAPRQPQGGGGGVACCGRFLGFFVVVVVFTKTPCKMDVRNHPRSHSPTSNRAAPERIWVYLRPSQHGTPDAGPTLIADTRGPRWSEPGTSTPAEPPRLQHDAVVNANTGPGPAGARTAGAALRGSVRGGRCWPRPGAAAPRTPSPQRCGGSSPAALTHGHGGLESPGRAPRRSHAPRGQSPPRTARPFISRGRPAALTGRASLPGDTFPSGTPRVGSSSGACFAENLSARKQEPPAARPPHPCPRRPWLEHLCGAEAAGQAASRDPAAGQHRRLARGLQPRTERHKRCALLTGLSSPPCSAQGSLCSTERWA